MILLRMITLNGLIHNRRVSVRYIASKKNQAADAISHFQWDRFRKENPHMNEVPSEIHPIMKSASAIFKAAL